MRIRNFHERKVCAPVAQVGELLDSLASENDEMWPHENWPRIKFDTLLKIGAFGRHGPIKYSVISYDPGKSIRFKFEESFEGFHELMIKEITANSCLLLHAAKAETSGQNYLQWLFVIRPLHNALVEDLFDKVERKLSFKPRPREWSLWVKVLRKLSEHKLFLR